MKPQEWFDAQLARWNTDPEFILEGVLLAVNERICELMDQKGITRAELARRLGKSRAYVSRLLNGQPNLTLRTLTEVAVALGSGIHVFVPSSVEDDRERALKAREAEDRLKWMVAERARWRSGSLLPNIDQGSAVSPDDEHKRYVPLAS